jgi:peptidoglycan-associated lipoprotein
VKKGYRGTLIVGAAVAGALALSGCATKNWVTGELTREVDRVETQVGGRLDNHETQLGTLDKTSREALERATAAGKLAEGKFLYSMVLSDDTVKFPVNESTLSPESEARLAEFANRLKSENRNVYVEIQGHTDAQGPEDFNERLGAQRAEAVRRFLSKQGLALNRMATISYGESEPVAANDTRDGRAQNRRVMIIVLS